MRSILSLAFFGAAVAAIPYNGYKQASYPIGTGSSSATKSSATSTVTDYTSSTAASTSLTGTGYSSATETTMTTYETTTVCPVTQTKTYGSSVAIETKLTTSTITVTTCKNGCHHSTKPYPTGTGYSSSTGTGIHGTGYTSTPSASNAPTHATSLPGDITTTNYITTTMPYTITSFVPCSTSIGGGPGKTIYSTWLSETYIPTSTVSVITSTGVVHPTGSNGAGSGNNGNGSHDGICPPAVTVTATVTATVSVIGDATHTACPDGHCGGHGGHGGEYTSVVGHPSSVIPPYSSSTGGASSTGKIPYPTGGSYTSSSSSAHATGSGYPTGGPHLSYSPPSYTYGAPEQYKTAEPVSYVKRWLW